MSLPRTAGYPSCSVIARPVRQGRIGAAQILMVQERAPRRSARSTQHITPSGGGGSGAGETGQDPPFQRP